MLGTAINDQGNKGRGTEQVRGDATTCPVFDRIGIRQGMNGRDRSDAMPLTVLRNTGFMKEQHPAKLVGASELHVATRGTTRQCRFLYADGLETADIELQDIDHESRVAGDAYFVSEAKCLFGAW